MSDCVIVTCEISHRMQFMGSRQQNMCFQVFLFVFFFFRFSLFNWLFDSAKSCHFGHDEKMAETCILYSCGLRILRNEGQNQNLSTLLDYGHSSSYLCRLDFDNMHFMQ